ALPEDLGREAVERDVGAAPRVLRQPGLDADLLEEFLRAPTPLGSDLRQQEAAPDSLLDVEAVEADLDLRGRRDPLPRPEDRDLESETREVLRRRGREARIVEERGHGVLLDVDRERPHRLHAP